MNDTPHDPRVPDQGRDDPGIQADRADRADTDDDDELVYDLTGKRRFLGGRRLVGVAVAATVLIGAGAAFVLVGGDDGGGEGDESATGDDGRSDVDFADAALEYADCMRGEGLEGWPDPVIDEDGGVDMDSGETYDMDMPEVQAAHEECRSIVDAAEDQRPQLTPEELAEAQDHALAMVQCMRDRGWDMPDPEVSADGRAGVVVDDGESNVPSQSDPDFEQFEQDQEECDEETGPADEGGGGGRGGS